MPEPDGHAASPAPPQAPDSPVATLESRLGVRFADRELALAALTHKSFVNEHRDDGLADNERLEFLGDAVIDLAVSHRLMERFPGAREGVLSKIRAAVVDETGLAAMARTLDLGGLLRLGRGEELTGGRRKASLLADAMEAVIAVVYLGGGLAPVLELTDRFFGEAFAQASAGTLDRDYKTQLQEQAQGRFGTTPRYRVVAEHGPDHAKTFEVEIELRGEVLGRGSGRSKKDAEQAAARGALETVAARAEGEAAPPAGEPPISRPEVAEPGPAPASATDDLEPPAPAPEAPPKEAREGRLAPVPAAAAPRRKLRVRKAAPAARGKKRVPPRGAAKRVRPGRTTRKR